jgi:hypothetical protein
MFLHAARASDGGATGMEKAGLGLFDAFFASLSMILVSEVVGDISGWKLISLTTLAALNLLFSFCICICGVIT